MFLGLSFMYSYRIPPQISGFGNIKCSYGQFEPFAGIITVLRLFEHDVLIRTWPICVAYL